MDIHAPSTGDLLVNRILDMVFRLHNNERFSKAEFAEIYGVSERTISRDLKRISSFYEYEKVLQKDNFGRYFIYNDFFAKITKAFGLEQLANGGGCRASSFSRI